MKTRIVARAILFDNGGSRILLIRNKGADYWFIPGGGWECKKESVTECAVREMKEETGLEVSIAKFLYLREYHDSPEVITFKSFWLATAKDAVVINQDHVDLDPNGAVEEAKWFKKEELSRIKLYPEIFKERFWQPEPIRWF